METTTPDFKYLEIEDHGEMIELVVELPNGDINRRRLRKSFKENYKEPTAATREAILFRNFDFESSRTLVFKLGGGLGDIVIAIESILCLKALIRERTKTEF